MATSNYSAIMEDKVLQMLRDASKGEDRILN